MPRPADLLAASRAHGVRDPRLLQAIAAVPRAQFVPPDLAEHAYQDVPLPIPHGQVTTQPSLVTQVVEALELSSSDRELEVEHTTQLQPHPQLDCRLLLGKQTVPDRQWHILDGQVT